MVPYLSSSIIRRPRGILIWSNSICEWQSQNRGGTPLSPDSHGNHPFLRSLRSVIAKPSTLVSWCSWNTSVTTVDIPDRIGPANANNELKKFGHVPRNQQSFCPWPLNRKVTINYDIKKLKSQLKISFNLINDKIIIEWMEIFIDRYLIHSLLFNKKHILTHQDRSRQCTLLVHQTILSSTLPAA